MSNVKRDLMKEIEAKVARKKIAASQASRQKTVANWVAEFFTEYEKTKNLEVNTAQTFTGLALNRLSMQLYNFDRRSRVELRAASDGNGPVIEIHWSNLFIKTNTCEEVLVFDASSAFFQSALEDI